MQRGARFLLALLARRLPCRCRAKTVIDGKSEDVTPAAALVDESARG
jgi:hypothetical protein